MRSVHCCSIATKESSADRRTRRPRWTKSGCHRAGFRALFCLDAERDSRQQAGVVGTRRLPISGRCRSWGQREPAAEPRRSRFRVATGILAPAPTVVDCARVGGSIRASRPRRKTPIERGSVTSVTGKASNRGERSGSRAAPGGRPGAALPRVRGPLHRADRGPSRAVAGDGQGVLLRPD